MEIRKYRYKVIEAIAKRFDESGIHFRVDTDSVVELIEAGFSIKCGPNVFVRFISYSDDNDIAVRVLGIMTGIPKQKRARILETCNIINCKKRYMKYTLDQKQGSVDVEYDFPGNCPIDFIADTCVSIFSGWAFNISSDYKLFVKAAYTNEPIMPNHGLSHETLLKIMKLKEKLDNIGNSDFVDDISDVLFDIDDLNFGEDDNYENDEDFIDSFNDYDSDESDDNILDDDDLDDIKDTDEEKSENADDEDTSS